MISHTTSELLQRFVHLQKIASSSSPVFPSASWEQWHQADLKGGFSLPVSYQLSGFLIEEIRKGESILLLRIKGHDLTTIGIFRSSPVMEVRSDGTVETFNSIYRVSYASVRRARR